MKILFTFSCFLLALLWSSGTWAQDTSGRQLNLALSLTTKAQREAYYALIGRFEQRHPDIKVNFHSLTSERYKLAFPGLIASGQFDVLYWHGGNRLMEHVKNDEVADISGLWQRQDWSSVFEENVQAVVSRNGAHYALPVSYYQMGFYYNRLLFEELGLSEPQNWQQFIAVCDALSEANVPPIFIGSKSNWPATAWFDYLNLRLNGLMFHDAVTRGEVDFMDARIHRVFTLWKVLIRKDCFHPNARKLDWREGLPLIYRGMTGMTLLGNYAVQEMPEAILENIGFFAFPDLVQGMPRYEEAPLDIFVIAKSSDNKPDAEAFLAFLGEAEQQTLLNDQLGVLSPHQGAFQSPADRLLAEASNAISTAKGISQFFDRDAEKTFADTIMPVIDDFTANADIDATLRALESIRTTHLKQLPTKH